MRMEVKVKTFFFEASETGHPIPFRAMHPSSCLSELNGFSEEHVLRSLPVDRAYFVYDNASHDSYHRKIFCHVDHEEAHGTLNIGGMECGKSCRQLTNHKL
jgi:hypothetical protein